MRSKGTSMMGSGISGLGEASWVMSLGRSGRLGRTPSLRPLTPANGSGRGSVGWCSRLRGSLPRDVSAPAPVRSQSLCVAPPTIIFPPPFAERHNRAGRFGR